LSANCPCGSSAALAQPGGHPCGSPSVFYSRSRFPRPQIIRAGSLSAAVRVRSRTSGLMHRQPAAASGYTTAALFEHPRSCCSASSALRCSRRTAATSSAVMAPMHTKRLTRSRLLSSEPGNEWTVPVRGAPDRETRHQQTRAHRARRPEPQRCPDKSGNTAYPSGPRSEKHQHADRRPAPLPKQTTSGSPLDTPTAPGGREANTRIRRRRAVSAEIAQPQTRRWPKTRLPEPAHQGQARRPIVAADDRAQPPANTTSETDIRIRSKLRRNPTSDSSEAANEGLDACTRCDPHTCRQAALSREVARNAPAANTWPHPRPPNQHPAKKTPVGGHTAVTLEFANASPGLAWRPEVGAADDSDPGDLQANP